VSAIGLALAVLIGVALGLFGGGGSLLTVPLLVYVLGLPPREAIASSLLVVMAASLVAALQHLRAGNLRLRVALLFGSAGMAGAHLGGRAAAFVDPSLLLLLLGCMMVLSALAMWRGRRVPLQAAPPAHAHARLVAQGFGVGLLTGLMGAGGGFLITPALVLWAGLPLPAAVGTSLLVIVLNALAGFSGYASHVPVDAGLVAALAAAAVAGSLIGARLAYRIDPASLRRAFAAFVLAMAAVVFTRETGVWIAAARSALPATLPQIAFALAVLLVGIATGRASRRAGAGALGERGFIGGAGI
jgi:uncharacterized membrane protein YfcA